MYYLSGAGLIVCKDVGVIEAFSCPWSPSSTFYKLLEIERCNFATKPFGLCPTAPVVSCDEAGREGFWLHRFLQAQGIATSVVDPSSLTLFRQQ